MVYRSNHNGIIFEFSVPEDKQKGTIVLVTGMPSVPKINDLLEKLANEGYLTVFPRYHGTWESSGSFLIQSPSVDIEDICNILCEGNEITELYAHNKFKITSNNLILIGSSFGGAVALCTAYLPSVKKVVALSPVVDWKDYAGEDTRNQLLHLGRFTKEAFGNGYRFIEKDWANFISGNLFNPPTDLPKEISSKIKIVYDKSDTTTPYPRIEEYARSQNISTNELSGVGHVSFSKISPLILLELIH